MNAWSQQEQEEEELHESSANRLYECKPVKNAALNSGVTKLGEIVNWERGFKLGEGFRLGELDW